MKPIRFSVCLFALVVLYQSAICQSTRAIPPGLIVTPKPRDATMANPHLVMGNQTCVKCHAAEIQVWKQTPHAHTLEELHRRPEAMKIASKLGMRSIKHEGRCVACHYTQQADPAGNPHVIAGISCESCHGPAKNWIEIHHNYGGESITRQTESPVHRTKRLRASIAAGMRNPINVYDVAQSCLRCHTTADEELVNVGGHSAGSLEFEFVAWSQGTLRHNFVTTEGKVNQIRSAEKLRVMFVAGMIAELEASLRATAVATRKATYGVTVARRGARAVKRLKSAAGKVNSPILHQIVRIGSSVTFQLNNRAELVQAADNIAMLGHQFADVSDGRDLSGIDRFVPKNRR